MFCADHYCSDLRGAATTASSAWARATLLGLVFSGGVAVMGLEMTASQLIKPYFGSTISVWTSLIGLVMIFLTAGYYLGGTLADRRPSRGHARRTIVLLAGVTIVVLPVVSIPVLRWAWGFTPTLGFLGGSFARRAPALLRSPTCSSAASAPSP